MWLPTPARGEGIFGVAIELPAPAAALVDPLRCPAQRQAFSPHITLVGPFALPENALPLLRRHLADVAAATAPFPVLLSGAATFLPVSPVAYLRVDDAAAARLTSLEAALRTGPLDVPSRFPFVPHVTLAMAHEPDQLERFLARAASAAVHFEAREFGLYRLKKGRAAVDGQAGGTSAPQPDRPGAHTGRAAGGTSAPHPDQAEGGAAGTGRPALLPSAQQMAVFSLHG